MKWFWISFFAFLTAVVVSVAILRPDTVDATLSFLGSFLNVAAWTALALLIAASVIGGSIAVWAMVRKHQVNNLRQRDGHYPLQRVKLRDGRIIYIDPNVMVSPALTVDQRTGAVIEHDPAAGWQVQATIRALVERTRTAQALIQGDESRSSRWGSEHRGDRVTAAAVRLMNSPRQQPAMPQPALAPPALPAPPVRIWTPEDALNTNTRTKLALGADTATGQIVKWDMLQAPHLRVHGKSQGSGKTNTIQTLAAGAVRTGAHLVVLDRRRFKDWGAFEGCAELVDTRDPRHFAQAVVHLCDLYQERDALLGQHGAPNIAALEQPPQRVVVVISEFGALCATAQAEGVLNDVLYPLSLILREAGAAGVHVLIEDQVVDQRWPRGISANAEPVTGYLPINYGAAGGYYDAHKLAPYQFHFGGTVFGTWPMAAVLPAVLARVQRPAPLVIDGAVVARSVRSTPFQGEGLPDTNARERSRERNAGTVNGTAPVSDDTHRWADVVAAWFAENPQALGGQARGVNDLARAMCREVEGNDANYEAYKGRAHKLFHDYRAQSNVRM